MKVVLLFRTDSELFLSKIKPNLFCLLQSLTECHLASEHWVSAQKTLVISSFKYTFGLGEELVETMSQR